VAFISADGYAVNLRAFARDPSTRKWDLGRDWQLEIPHEGASEFPYVHISWSHLGTDLAVVDAAGHVSIFNCASALERMEYKRVELAQPDADMDAVVGMHWLALSPHEVKTTIVWSASETGKTWSLRTGAYIIPDLHHPIDNKASMIYLKRYGELRMRFQQVDNTWHEVVAQLGPMLSTCDAFSHAAFASNSGKHHPLPEGSYVDIRR
jgi:mediator of RNA polymerase II transcription subunit 16